MITMPEANYSTRNEKSAGRDVDLEYQPRSLKKAPSIGRSGRQKLAIVILLLGLWLALRGLFAWRPRDCLHQSSHVVELGENVTLVPFEAHIMSKCPDAKDCLNEMVVPAMIEISDKVNFTLSYIGSVDPDSDEVSCKHGPGECLGNLIQLCAAREYPDPKIYLGFANCMTSDYANIPDRDLVEECAMEHSVNFQTLNACISDEGNGIDLLRASIERSQDNNVTKSCTVRLNNKIRCIRDGGKWYDCPGGSHVTDLIGEVEELYKKLN